ncbi:MAG: 2-hydroxyacyl-CoA dehydratase [Deltaproteobacteria bacterium]|nr:2-hydroxyacyl-CoA dehydratase [Deltaproteobacteria bacterium]MBW2121456.1 2-hydroxyacyl-CoA dehydratase [Deltaproteobacteria bacterium]
MEDPVISELSAIANYPYDMLREYKRQGRRIIGSTLPDVPEELVHAAGLLPFTILGTNRPIRRAGALLPDNSCSLARSTLELVLTYETGLFDGFILPQVDDTTQHLSDIWRRRIPSSFFEPYLVPRQVDRPSSRQWLLDETHRLKESLERYTAGVISDGSLRRSIVLYNRNRRILRRIYAMKRKTPGLISNRAFFELIKSSMFLPKERHNRYLEQLLPRLEQELPSGRTRNLRFVVAGVVWEPPSLMTILDELGIEVVGDDLCTGTRYIEADASTDGDPVGALVDRHFHRGPFSPIHDKGNRILANLLDLVRQHGADGILYLRLKFFESQDYDLPDLKREIQAQGIPIYVLDTEYQTIHLAQTKTRIQAFAESLPGGGT